MVSYNLSVIPMMKTTMIFLAFAGISAGCFAQQAPPANPLTTGERMVYSFLINYAVQAADKMPEENYGFKPAPDVRSFGQLVGHLADANNMFCGTVLGEPRATVSIEKTKTSKADLIQALKDAVAHCNKAYGALTDASAVETVKFMGRDFPKLTVMSINMAHSDEHYGNMVTYMRMKGIVPPSSEQRTPPPAEKK